MLQKPETKIKKRRQCKLKGCRQRVPQEAPQWAVHCSEECGLALAMLAVEKDRAARQRAHKRQQEAERKEQVRKTRAQREAAKTIKQWVSDAQDLVNRVVVAEDRDKGCISCGCDVTECGHYFHRGTKYAIARLTLLRLNLNGQCGDCNRYRGGNQHEYRLGMIERYGEAAFDELCEFKRKTDRGEIRPLSIDDCRQIIAESKARLKVLASV